MVPPVMIIMVLVNVRAIVPPVGEVIIEIIRPPEPVVIAARPGVVAVVVPAMTMASIADPVHLERPSVGMPECRAGEVRGGTVQGGAEYHVVKGDIIVVRPGLPTWFKEVPHNVSYLAVKKFAAPGT